MTNTLKANHIKLYHLVVAIFLYATLVVDLYRKYIDVNVEIVRNVIYAFCLGMIIWDAIKTKRFANMLLVFVLISLLYFFSSQIYLSHGQAYFTGWLLFVSRLWPAYYVGRYTEDWLEVSNYMRKFIWIALAYALFAFTAELYMSGGGNSSYSTISSNLFMVAWVAFYDSFHRHKLLSMIVCLFCFIPVLFLGTRAGLFGAVLAFVLFGGRAISRSTGSRKAVSYFLLIISAVVLILFFNTISVLLSDLFPNSRTLDFLLRGELFEDSNRSDSYYSRMWSAIQDNPLKMYGLIGNQIFLAGENASIEAILGSFAHNVYLELCMNFGVVIGLFLGLYFTILLIKAYLKSKWRNRDIEFVYLGFLGMTFIGMMVSESWQFSYQIWLLIGMAYRLVRSNSIRAV